MHGYWLIDRNSFRWIDSFLSIRADLSRLCSPAGCLQPQTQAIGAVDIITISSGFVLRACAGAAATGIDLSVWFLVCTAMLALFLAIEKRKAELRRGGNTRSVLKRYSLSLLLRLENIATTGTLMSYALWSAGTQIGGSATTPWMLLTFPFVLYGVFRYQLLSDPVEVWQDSAGEPMLVEHTERPEKVLLTDGPLLLTVASWGITALAILWLERHGLIQ